MQLLICVLFLCVAIIQSPQNQSACEGGTVNFTCVVMFPNGTVPGGASWFDRNNNDVSDLRGHTKTNDLNGRASPVNVTNVLTVTNVNTSDSGGNYICVRISGYNVISSDITFLTVFGKDRASLIYEYIL